MTANPQRMRPRINPGYGINQTPEGMLDWAWAEERLIRSHNYWVTTVSDQRVPHVTPVWGVWHTGQFIFGAHPESRKARNILAWPRIVVNLESGDECVIVHGRAHVTQDTALLRQIQPQYASKYNLPDFNPIEDPSASMFIVTPKYVLAWLEADYLNTATRFVFA
ncbi:MAG: pyridoxamine 5'-phosphate oxidase family protein [Candidatus Flexifilum sp.]